MNLYIEKDNYTILRITNKRGDTYDVKISSEDVARCKKRKWIIHKIRVYLAEGHTHKVYVSSEDEEKKVLLHRFVMDAPKGMEVDHIEGDTLDNRREKLRVCTHQENLCNRKKRTDNKSGHPGVFWYTHCPTPKWVAYIKVNYKRIHLGNFEKLEDAIKARQEAEEKYFGEYARAVDFQ